MSALMRFLRSLFGQHSPEPFDFHPSSTQQQPHPAQSIESGPCTVTMVDLGPKKIEVIKVVRALTHLGLKETKDLVESFHPIILQNVSESAAFRAKTDLERAGARVSMTPNPQGSATISTPAVDTQGQFAIMMMDVGPQKIEVIKVVRMLTDLGLKKTKDLVESYQPIILQTMTEAEALRAKTDLERAGATVTITPNPTGTMMISNSAPAVDTQGQFTIMLMDIGPKKIEVIKVVRILTNLGLKEAKNLVESYQPIILQNVSESAALRAKANLEDAGAAIAITPNPTLTTYDESQFTIMLMDIGPQKIEVLKVVRMLTNLGLKEAKDLVESYHPIILQNVSESAALRAKADLERAGAAVAITPNPQGTVTITNSAPTYDGGQFAVTMMNLGPKKIEVIKVVRSLTNLGLKEAKDMVESYQPIILRTMTEAEALKAKSELERAGAAVSITPPSR